METTVEPATDGAGAGPDRTRSVRIRLVAAKVTTALACLVVLAALTAPNRLGHLTPAAFVRIPAEALLGAALLLVVPDRWRRVAAVVAGMLLGILAILTIIDIGFSAVLARPFDPVLDWYLLQAGVVFLTDTIGRPATILTVVLAVVLALAVLVAMRYSVMRVTRLLVAHRTRTARGPAVLAPVWVACAVLGVQIVPGVPVGAHHYDRLRQIPVSLSDSARFAVEAAHDPFAETPGEQLLSALRGKDVILVFVEAYGRAAVEDPRIAPRVDAALDAGTARLAAAGYDARSAFLTSATVGGGSWLAHATLLSGLWVGNQVRYARLPGSGRMTLTGAFKRAGWHTAGVMPGMTQDWPEADPLGYQQIYQVNDLGYRGPHMNWGRGSRPVHHVVPGTPSA